jgi:hypothetical protein
MAGWGWMKDKMRMFIKSIRDLGKNVIIIAHVEEKDDEGRMIKRPRVMTKLSEELIALVDIVGYMEVVKVNEEEKRFIRVAPSEKYEGKDRTGQLGGIIPPDFSAIIEAVHGTKKFKWSSDKSVSTNAIEKTEKVLDEMVDEVVSNTKKETVGDKLKRAKTK